MPTWGQILYELNKLIDAQQKASTPPDPFGPSPHDIVRRKYLKELAAYTGRPVIVYASGWMEGRPVRDPSEVSVAGRDVMGFMEAVSGLPSGPLDLILHSPGGDQNAAQAIMSYLRGEGFGPIRAFVPVAAMSAATMMALSCDEIVMGRHSQLGPIDPQFTIVTPEGPRAAPAQAILDQFEEAKRDCAASPQSLAAWLPILRGYGPGLLSQCITAQAASEELVATAMEKHMFSGDADGATKAKAIAAWFNDHKQHRSHGRPIRYDDAHGKGVRVSLLEEGTGELQDKVLSAWHGVQLSLSQVAVSKLVENHEGKAWLLSSVQFMVQAPVPAPAPPSQPLVPAAPALNRQQQRQQDRKRSKGR